MHRFAWLIIVCAVTAIMFAGYAVPPAAAAGESAAPSANAPIRVLIVDGSSNHDWRLTTRVIQSILAQHGGFEVQVSTVPTTGTAQLSAPDALAAWAPDFQNYDVVLQNYNDQNGKGPRWPPNVERALEDYLRGGGGLYVYHSAENAFAQWHEYNNIIGLGWRRAEFGKAVAVNDDGVTTRTIPAGEGGSSNHFKRHDALGTRIGDHPIHAGLPRQFLAADVEVYTWQRSIHQR